MARGVGLAAGGFAATLILLFGLAGLVRPSGGGSSSRATATAATPSAPPIAVASGGATPSVSPSNPTTSTGQPAGSPPGLPSGDPVLVGAGDIADCALADDDATAALVDSIAGTVFTAGDNAYPDGSAAQFRDCYGPTWGRFLTRTRSAPGNHDWVTKDLAGYLGYFGSAAAPDGKSWYSYDLGTWHIIVLDSDCSSVGGCGADSPQGGWLAADLKASTARCTLAIWHHPRFSSGEHGNDTEVAPLWTALAGAAADVVVNGHDHDYERFAPQDSAGQLDRAGGLREFVVGTGGAALRPFPTTATNSEVRATGAHGVIRFVLHQGSFEWRFISTSGAFSDAGSAVCH